MAGLRLKFHSLKAVCLPQSLTTVYISTRQSSDVVKSQYDNLTAYRRGEGGRGSFSGVVATVFGCSGYLGRYVVARLGKNGTQIICPYRGDPYYVKDLKLAGDLGQVLFLPFHLNDETSLRKCMKYSNVVINVIGRDYETKNFSFRDVHVDGPRRIARIARELGVERFVHVSHLNADLEPRPIFMKGGSEFLRCKQLGEDAVKEEFPDATILRPADIFGLEDQFLHYYINPLRRSLQTMPLWKKGEKTIKRPVFLGNVVEGIVMATMNPDAIGKTYECIGPNAYYLSDLIDYIYRVLRWSHIRRTYVTPITRLKASLLTAIQFDPQITVDKLDREHISDNPRGYPTLEELGVELEYLENRIQWELKPHRKFLYYEESVGEFPDPEKPPVVTA